MADEANIAQEYLVDQNEVALKTISSNLTVASTIPSLEFCEDCDAPIPEQRRAIGGVECCTECQTLRDKYPNVRYDARGRVIKEIIAND